MKILVIQQKMIGDVLISSMICNNLRTAYPTAQIDYLVNSFTIPVIANNPNISNIVEFKDKYRESKMAFIKFILGIRRQKYDVVIDAYGKLESCLITYFSGAKKRIGYGQKDKFFAYNHKADHPNKKETFRGLAIDRRINLLTRLMKHADIDPYPHIFLTETEIQEGASLFEKHQIDLSNTKVILISVFGSEPNKTYPLEYLTNLINKIAEHKQVTLLFNYMRNQRKEVELLASQCSAEAQKKINLDVVGTDLRSLMKITYHCNILVGNDGGAVNIAKALNKPTYTLFSPWIDKDSWSIFEDGEFHKAVHLKEFYPEIFTQYSRKQLKEKSKELYTKLKPELFQDAMFRFIDSNLE